MTIFNDAPLNFRPRFGRALKVFVCLSVSSLMAACGGGGGGDSSAAAPLLVTGANVMTITLDGGPPGLADRVANTPYASVTVCPAGSGAGCQTIDHVLLDTGSTGLRILASALGNPASFPAQVDGSSRPYVECAQFVNGNTWGPVRTADVTLGSLTAAAVPIQIIADAAYPTVPASCSSTGTIRSTQNELHGNGILGIGHFRQDCGATCVSTVVPAGYYSCATSSTCISATIARVKQVTNPVALLATDNNGSMLQLPPVPDAGAVAMTGALALGIGTQSNNVLGAATVFGVNGTTGLLTTTYNGHDYTASAFDSGSNFYFFTDSGITACPPVYAGFYCPASTLALNATIKGANGATGSFAFNIANASTVFNVNAANSVLPNVGATLGFTNSFLWGLPFYYGRKVFTAIEGASTPGGTGPYVAF